MTTTTLDPTRPPRAGNLLALLILAGWGGLIIVLALDGFFAPPVGTPPLRLLVSGALVLAAFTAAWFLLPAFRAWVLALDMRLLIQLHSLRMLGMGFVMLYMVDRLPMSFAFLAGFGDALTAIGAVALVWAMMSHRDGVSRRWIWRWNTFGLLDFIVALTVGILTRQGGVLYPAGGPDSDLMTSFPFAFIPAFLVQVFTLTHIIIYLQLRHRHAGTTRIRIAPEA
ncbi:MAG TPA: hypothetical protein ENJ01_06160 [Gammaproteobacteria bacterium]|nr:hypothetical protein [Gammaproteobacteria bacterium]